MDIAKYVVVVWIWFKKKELLAKNWNAESLIQEQDLTSVEIED